MVVSTNGNGRQPQKHNTYLISAGSDRIAPETDYLWVDVSTLPYCSSSIGIPEGVPEIPKHGMTACWLAVRLLTGKARRKLVEAFWDRGDPKIRIVRNRSQDHQGFFFTEECLSVQRAWEPETLSQWRADCGAVGVPWVRHLVGIFCFLESWSSQFGLGEGTTGSEPEEVKEWGRGGGVRNCGVGQDRRARLALAFWAPIHAHGSLNSEEYV